MWLLIVLIPLGIVAAVLLILTITLDDWRRDLSKNWATTDAEAIDEMLRPLELSATSDDVVSAVRDWADSQPHWTLVDEQSTGDVTELHLVRTTRWLRYRDVVTLRVQRLADNKATLITAESRSRVGRADFGQNPRNLKEVLSALRQSLD